nr:immunoglobulin heavy chain junction region [Mus musculus]
CARSFYYGYDAYAMDYW